MVDIQSIGTGHGERYEQLLRAVLSARHVLPQWNDLTVDVVSVQRSDYRQTAGTHGRHNGHWPVLVFIKAVEYDVECRSFAYVSDRLKRNYISCFAPSSTPVCNDENWTCCIEAIEMVNVQ